MSKYRINIGDYVETWDGDFGYIVDYCRSIVENKTDEYEIVYRITHSNSGKYIGNEVRAAVNCFKRIGINDFTKLRFKPIKKRLGYFCNFEEVVCEINKLIDYINVIQERLNEYDSKKERP